LQPAAFAPKVISAASEITSDHGERIFLNRFRPDIVILNYVVNDAEPVPPHPAINVLRRACYSCLFVAGRIENLIQCSAFGDSQSLN
jgi:hypothetical protein